MMNTVMKKIVYAGVVMVVFCMAHEPREVYDIVEPSKGNDNIIPHRGIFIAQAGGLSSILGPQGKNITVCRHGDNIAFAYGGLAYPYGEMDMRIAYSVDTGLTWTLYGPFSGPEPFLHPGVDGSVDFCTDPGELYYVWQCDPGPYDDGDLKCMIEENVPSAPSPGVPVSLPNAIGLNARLPSIAVSVDDPGSVIITAMSYMPASIYCWITTDHGYTWSDSIRMIDAVDQDGDPGHIRWGSEEYIFYNYQDGYDWQGTSMIYPHYVESTDGGWTWSQPAAMPEVPTLDTVNTQFWGTELDCEVIEGEPWAVHHDLNMVTPDSAGFWIFHATGDPGNWTWEIFDINELGACSTWVGDTLFYCSPGQYPSVAFDPVSSTILIAYKADFLKVYGTDTLYAGPHIGGIYTVDNGASWTTCAPLCGTHSTGVAWEDWSATEVAHRLVNTGGSVYSYAVWINDMTMEQFFERGLVRPFIPLAVAEQQSSTAVTRLYSVPTIVGEKCEIRFTMHAPARVMIDLYDVTGRFVHHVFDGYRGAGAHEFEIRLSDKPAGVYFVNLEADRQIYRTKIIVVR